MTDLRILYADDCPMTRRVMVELLFGDRYAVDQAHNGQEAVIKLLSRPPGHYGLIITDYDMPVMDGVQLSKIILGANYPAKLVMYSGSDLAELRRALLPLSVDMFPKGDPMAFRRYLHGVLESMPRPAGLETSDPRLERDAGRPPLVDRPRDVPNVAA